MVRGNSREENAHRVQKLYHVCFPVNPLWDKVVKAFGTLLRLPDPQNFYENTNHLNAKSKYYLLNWTDL